MAGDCIACHIQGGQAGGTQLVLEPGMSPDAIAANFETIENLALDKSMGASLLILKPTGQVAHGGGQRFAEGDAIYDSFIELIARYEEPGGCEDPSIKYACENAPINPGPTHLRRLTNAQYHNTIMDLFGGLIDSGVDFPQTTIHAGFSSYAGPNLVSAAGAQSIFDSAENIGAQIAEDVDSFLQCGNTPEPSCIVDFIKNALGADQIHFAFGRQLQTTRGPYQKTGCQPVFDPCDKLADSRWRQMQLAPGFGKASEFRDPDEDFHFPCAIIQLILRL